MKVLNSKILFELLPQKNQPTKTIFSPTGDMLKLARVIDTGGKTEFVKKDDIITVYEITMNMISKTRGFCSERDVIFYNDKPQPGKIHIKHPEKEPMENLSKAKVVSSNTSDILEEGCTIRYLKGQSHILPDHTEIISESQGFYIE